MIGKIVCYRLTKTQAEQINRNRTDGRWTGLKGAQPHIGNPVYEGQILPMIIVRVWTDSVNGQCLLDGNDSEWVISVKEGNEPGQWHSI